VSWRAKDLLQAVDGVSSVFELVLDALAVSLAEHGDEVDLMFVVEAHHCQVLALSI
jgi:hypothetical protein